MSAATSVSCGERLVHLLEAYGIDTVYGIPGNHTVQLYRGLSTTAIRHISPRHEQGAAFMADGYARASGKPAACFLISGPGLGNAITPMIQALADSVPMLVISSVAARDQLGMGEGRLHELPDQRALAAQCSRFSHTLMSPGELPKVLARVFAVFASQRPGPVHIEIPLDVIDMDASDVSSTPWPKPLAPSATSAGLDELAERLLNAKTPCLIAGGGSVAAAEELGRLAEMLDAPLLTTVNAKGVLAPDHPLLVGGSPSLASVRELLSESDAVFAIGTEFGETDYDMLFLGALPSLTWLARLDIDPHQLARNIRPDLALVGDAKASISLLLDKLSGSQDRDGKRRVKLARQAISGEEHYSSDMQAFFSALTETLPGLCLVGDSTLPTYYAVWQYRAPAPRRYFHSATGGGTLGYAIPAAIGVRRALGSDVPVVALIGDGAAQFSFMELAAAVQEELPIIVLLWNNAGYSEIKKGMIASEVSPVGVDIDPPKFVLAAKALGCKAITVDSLDELPQALTSASLETVPSLIELNESNIVNDAAGNWY